MSSNLHILSWSLVTLIGSILVIVKTANGDNLIESSNKTNTYSEVNTVPQWELTIPDQAVGILVQEEREVTILAQQTDPIADGDQSSLQLRVSFLPDALGVIDDLPPKNVTTFGKSSFSFRVRGVRPGVVTVVVNTTCIHPGKAQLHIPHGMLFVRITVSRSSGLHVLSAIFGWIYVVAWNISFYPQVLNNFSRKSVVGLNFDYLAYNTLGHTFYMIFNIGLYSFPGVIAEYIRRHPFGIIPVEINDIFFAVHSVALCLVSIWQCIIYERGNQTISQSCKIILFGIVLFALDRLYLSITNTIDWLDMLYFMAFIKILITLLKYVPQAHMNFRRKSTFGWAIGTSMLDLIGGVLSILQMCLIAYNHDDWASLLGNAAKLGLGGFSIFFDLVFLLQHYILYRNQMPIKTSDEGLEEETLDLLPQTESVIS